MSEKYLVRQGRVCSGRGLASSHLAPYDEIIGGLMGSRPQSGSLNIALDVPLKLSTENGVWLDRNESRMVWPARLNGETVLIYRWSGCPLSVVEVISNVHLRSEMGLRDDDTVVVAIERRISSPLTWLEKIGWVVLWMGRSRFYYRDAYRNYTVSLQRFFFREIDGRVLMRSVFNSFLRVVRGAGRSFKLARGLDLQSSFVRKTVGEGVDGDFDRVLNVLAYTKTSGSAYSAAKYPAGYHTIEVDGVVVPGQRLPSARLDLLPISLQGLSVLDIGCNQGGMLFGAEGRGIRWGVGIDYDSRMINAANKVKQFRGISCLDFFVFDLEKEQLALITDYLPESDVDLVMLLSVCMWIGNWREVVTFCANLAPSMLFESNGSEEQQVEQVDFLRRNFSTVEMLQLQSDDDAGQRNRQLYYCRR